MSLFMQKQAVEKVSSVKKNRKSRKRDRKAFGNPMQHVCRIEPLEKREYLAADPISVGVVYTEQYQEDLGDRFYVAWVGGEESTTLDSITINLDKNGNGQLDEGEAFFDVSQGGLGSYASVPFTLVDKTSDIGYSYEVEDGGMILKISFTNFHAGDHFVFQIDLDEYQGNSSSGIDNSQVEGGEMGGSLVNEIGGSIVSTCFTSEHYNVEDWTGLFVDQYDEEYSRPEKLANAYDSSLLPYDLDDGNEGVDQAGVYGDVLLSPKPIVISGYVYGDRNVDCNYDVGSDDPLSNVEVTLVGEDGRRWTTTTDVNGFYEFAGDDLLPGSYKIYTESNITSPEGWTYFDFCAKGGKFGEKISPLEIDVSGMQGGEIAPDNNFAKALVSTISGSVFEDFNNANGKDPGESWDGTAYPAKIELWRIDTNADGSKTYTLMETQTVDSEGNYKFVLDGSWNEDGTLRKLPEKTYEIREIFSSEDYADGNDYIGSLGGMVANEVFSDVFVGYGENGYNYDFGELKLGSIEGNVWEDRNDNGVIDAGENGIANVVIELYQWDGSKYVKIAETTTDEDGSYLFENLDINNIYAVKELQPAAYDDGKDSVGSLGGDPSDDYVSNVSIGWDDHGTDYNFGELKLGSIAGNVFEDRNNNGVFDQSEKGIAGVPIELYEWNGSEYVKIAETLTAEDGSYLFDKLDVNKEYAVREKQPDDYSDGKDSVGSLGGEVVDNDEIRSIPIAWNDHGVNYDFGELKLGSIAGNVFEDRNNNGLFDSAEAGIGGVTVELYQLINGSYVKIAEQKTSDDGSYSFDNLDINQKYGVKEIQPSAYDDGKDSVGSLGGTSTQNDYISDVDVQWDEHGVNYNFGELKLGSVSGYVYHDENNNGLMDTGEKGIGSVTVELYRLENGQYVKIAETQTDESGFYKFDSLDIEQTYAVREIQPSSWDDGKDAVGTLGGELGENDEINGVNVFWDAHGEEYNFGELLPPGSLSGYVYEDVNNNGVKDDGEKGIKDVTLELYVVGEDGKATLVATQKTDENGYYKFDLLEPGKTYVVRETQPSAYYDGKDAVGSILGKTVGSLGENDEIKDITLGRGEEGVHYDFGELTPASISGYVYEDINNNGVKESGEKGIPGTTLTLEILNEETGKYESTNLTAQTNSEGYYIFKDLEPCRVYRIVESQPANYRDGKDSIGSLGGLVSNDVLYSISVQPGDAGTDYNFGELPRVEIPDAGSSTPNISYQNNIWSPSPTSFPYIWYQPTIPGSMTTLYGGGGFIDNYSWKLSVLNGTLPRADEELLEYAYGGYYRGNLDSDPKLMNVSASRNELYDFSDGEWDLLLGDGKVYKYKMGGRKAQPVTGDWLGEGVDKIGFFIDGRWYLDTDGDGKYDVYVELGASGDQAVTGDWDGDGKSDVAVFGVQKESDERVITTDPGLASDLNQLVNVSVSRPKNLPPTAETFANPDNYIREAKVERDTTGKIRQDLIDHIFQYGAKDDVAVTGDWNGDGITEIGVYRNGSWYLDMDGDGRWDETKDKLVQGRAGGYLPVVGDWNGDGIDNIGVFADGTWILDSDGDYRYDKTLHHGQKGDKPVTGDWDGDGVDDIGVYRDTTSGDSSDSDSSIHAQTDGDPSNSYVMND